MLSVRSVFCYIDSVHPLVEGCGPVWVWMCACVRMHVSVCAWWWYVISVLFCHVCVCVCVLISIDCLYSDSDGTYWSVLPLDCLYSDRDRNILICIDCLFSDSDGTWSLCDWQMLKSLLNAEESPGSRDEGNFTAPLFGPVYRPVSSAFRTFTIICVDLCTSPSVAHSEPLLISVCSRTLLLSVSFKTSSIICVL